jgi:2-hydroxychromene-2-carboxylate isomerase
MDRIDVYYDYRSPYAYFASRALPMLAQRLHIEVAWKPVSIHMLLNLQVGRPPRAAYEDPLPPIKRRYLVQDVVRGAQQRRLPIGLPKSLESLAALQISHALGSGEAEAAFRERVWQAVWVEGQDISSREGLASCLAPVDERALDLLDAALRGDHVDGIEERSREAFSAGVFGVPTMLVDGEVFFGSDRLDAVEWRIRSRSEEGG